MSTKRNPGNRPPNPEGTKNRADILRLIGEGEKSSLDLIDLMDLHAVNIRRYLKELNKAKLIHVCGWTERDETVGGCRAKIYAIGDGNNVRAPKNKTAHERHITYYSKNKAVLKLRRRLKKGATINPYEQLWKQAA